MVFCHFGVCAKLMQQSSQIMHLCIFDDYPRIMYQIVHIRKLDPECHGAQIPLNKGLALLGLNFPLTAIPRRIHRISSDLRS